MQTLLKAIRVCVVDPQPIMRSALKACLRTTEGILVSDLLANWDELETCLSHNPIDVVVIDATLLNAEDLPRLQSLSQAAWLVLASLPESHKALLQSGAVQALLNKDTGVTELTRTVLSLGSGLPTQLKSPPTANAPASPKPAKRPKVAKTGKKNQPASSATAAKTTPREQEVLDYLAQGLSLSAIAEKMGIQVKTVKTYQSKLKRKNLG